MIATGKRKGGEKKRNATGGQSKIVGAVCK